MEKKHKNITLDIYTGHYWEAVIIQHLLKDKGIEVFLKNEKNAAEATMFKSLSPWDTVTVVVSDLNSEKAKVIVSEYEKKTPKDIPET